MPVSAAHLRELADRLEAEEAEAQRELEQATTAQERQAQQERIDKLERELEALKGSAGSPTGGGAPPPGDPPDEPDEPDDDPPPPRRTRPGRKRGQVYQDKPGEAGYVYQGDDEPDEVELDA